MAVLIKFQIMLIFLEIYLIFLFQIERIECNSNNELKAVVVVYRHGDRTPVKPYPNDPYRNASYWPVGFGQLTNIGKMQHYELGKWLRVRYENFLSDEYNENEIRIQSTDVDRTIMSAEANLAGLYPPKNQQIWNTNIKWQPIPIHTIPEIDDPILAMKKPCLKYKRLLMELLTKNEYFRNVTYKNHDLYSYLTRYSGTKITNLETLEYLYNTLMIEKINNFTLPKWTTNVFPDKMQFSAELSFATGCYTRQLARLKTGLWYRQLIEFFQNHTTTTTTTNKKMLIYSGHDITIANLLNTIGAFQLHCPPYASAILFELYLNNSNEEDNYFINVLYKNSTTRYLQKIIVNGCDFNCKLNDFIVNLDGIVLNYNQWLIECDQLNSFQMDYFLLFVVLSIIFISLFLITFISMVALRCFKNKQHSLSYQQLPNDEEVA